MNGPLNCLESIRNESIIYFPFYFQSEIFYAVRDILVPHSLGSLFKNPPPFC